MGTFAKSAHKKAKWPEMAKLTGIQRYDQQVLVMGSMGTKTTHVYGAAWVTQPERQRHEGQSKLEVSCQLLHTGCFFFNNGPPPKSSKYRQVDLG